VNVNHYKWLRCPVVSLFLFSVLGLTGSAASAQTPDQPDANAVSAQAPDPNTVKEIISLQGGSRVKSKSRVGGDSCDRLVNGRWL
jgi:hypothetical protein